jgi:hypothetical protein
MMLRIDIHHWFVMVAIFESKMAAKIKKSTDLGEIWFPSRL